MILEPKKIKSDSVSTVSPSISHEVWDQMLKCVLNMFVFQGCKNILSLNLIFEKSGNSTLNILLMLKYSGENIKEKAIIAYYGKI